MITSFLILFSVQSAHVAGGIRVPMSMDFDFANALDTIWEEGRRYSSQQWPFHVCSLVLLEGVEMGDAA